MTQGQSSGRAVRWALLVFALLCWALGAFWLIDPAWPRAELHWLLGDKIEPLGLQGVLGIEFDNLAPYSIAVAVYLGLFLFTQWLFLTPRGSWRIRITDTGRPARKSIAAAGLVAALLTVGLLATVLEAGDWWQSVAPIKNGPGSSSERISWAIPLAALLAAWLLWAIVFALYRPSADRYTWLTRVLRGLIAGSILELLVATPVHFLVRPERNDCYCARGSYTGLVLGGTALCWVFGPGVALLFLREKARREKLLAPQP